MGNIRINLHEYRREQRLKHNSVNCSLFDKKNISMPLHFQTQKQNCDILPFRKLQGVHNKTVPNKRKKSFPLRRKQQKVLKPSTSTKINTKRGKLHDSKQNYYYDICPLRGNPDGQLSTFPECKKLSSTTHSGPLKFSKNSRLSPYTQVADGNLVLQNDKMKGHKENYLQILKPPTLERSSLNTFILNFIRNQDLSKNICKPFASTTTSYNCRSPQPTSFPILHNNIKKGCLGMISESYYPDSISPYPLFCISPLETSSQMKCFRPGISINDTPNTLKDNTASYRRDCIGTSYKYISPASVSPHPLFSISPIESQCQTTNFRLPISSTTSLNNFLEDPLDSREGDCMRSVAKHITPDAISPHPLFSISPIEFPYQTTNFRLPISSTTSLNNFLEDPLDSREGDCMRSVAKHITPDSISPHPLFSISPIKPPYQTKNFRLPISSTTSLNNFLEDPLDSREGDCVRSGTKHITPDTISPHPLFSISPIETFSEIGNTSLPIVRNTALNTPLKYRLPSYERNSIETVPININRLCIPHSLSCSYSIENSKQGTNFTLSRSTVGRVGGMQSTSESISNLPARTGGNVWFDPVFGHYFNSHRLPPARNLGYSTKIFKNNCRKTSQEEHNSLKSSSLYPSGNTARLSSTAESALFSRTSQLLSEPKSFPLSNLATQSTSVEGYDGNRRFGHINGNQYRHHSTESFGYPTVVSKKNYQNETFLQAGNFSKESFLNLETIPTQIQNTISRSTSASSNTMYENMDVENVTRNVSQSCFYPDVKCSDFLTNPSNSSYSYSKPKGVTYLLVPPNTAYPSVEELYTTENIGDANRKFSGLDSICHAPTTEPSETSFSYNEQNSKYSDESNNKTNLSKLISCLTSCCYLFTFGQGHEAKQI